MAVNILTMDTTKEFIKRDTEHGPYMERPGFDAFKVTVDLDDINVITPSGFNIHAAVMYHDVTDETVTKVGEKVCFESGIAPSDYVVHWDNTLPYIFIIAEKSKLIESNFHNLLIQMTWHQLSIGLLRGGKLHSDNVLAGINRTHYKDVGFAENTLLRMDVYKGIEYRIHLDNTLTFAVIGKDETMYDITPYDNHIEKIESIIDKLV